MRHKRFRAESMNTEERRIELIGGEGKFCAQRIGYTETAEGLSPALAPEEFTPQVTIMGVRYAIELASIKTCVLFNSFGQYYRWNSTDITTLNSPGFLTKYPPIPVPVTVDGEAAYLVYCGAKVATVKHGSQSQKAAPVSLYCGDCHCGRLFARDLNDPYLLRWSAFDMTDWTEGVDKGGHLKLSHDGGEVLAIKSFGDRLIVVRQFSLNVISVLADSRHMRVELMKQYTLPTVQADTCVICGGKLYFYTARGAYCYDGSGVSPLALDMCGIEGKVTKANAALGRYVVFALEFTEGETATSAFLFYDTATGASFAAGKGMKYIFTCDNELFCINDKYITRLKEGGSDPNRVWRSVTTDFGISGVKTLKALTMEGDGSVIVDIDCDGRKSGVSKSMYSPVKTENVMQRGRRFTFTVTGSGRVTKLEAVLEVER